MGQKIFRAKDTVSYTKLVIQRYLVFFISTIAGWQCTEHVCGILHDCCIDHPMKIIHYNILARHKCVGFSSLS